MLESPESQATPRADLPTTVGVSVVIPVKNGGDEFRRCLDAIVAQRLDTDFEVIVVDSGSTDDTAALAESYGARVHQIPAEHFNHGATRNLGVSLATGDFIAFTSHDAEPVDPDWLQRLVAPLREDARVAGVYGRQIPHADAKPPERFFLEFLYGPRPKVQRAATREELSMQTTLFSNANSVIRRDVLERFPFASDIIMSEDQEWSRRVLLAGYAIAYEPRAVVRHSHDYTFAEAFRRFFDSGVSAERAYLPDDPAARRALRRRALRYPVVETSWLWRSGHRRWIPYALAYQGMKFAGLALGTLHARLPRSWSRRLSASPGYWA